MNEKLFNDVRKCLHTHVNSSNRSQLDDNAIRTNCVEWSINKRRLKTVLSDHVGWDEERLSVHILVPHKRPSDDLSASRFFGRLKCILSCHPDIASPLMRDYAHAGMVLFNKNIGDSDVIQNLEPLDEHLKKIKQQHRIEYEAMLDDDFRKMYNGLSISSKTTEILLAHLQIKNGTKKSKAFMKIYNKLKEILNVLEQRSPLLFDKTDIFTYDVPDVKYPFNGMPWQYSLAQTVDTICDYLNPKDSNIPYVISIHPCDYLTQSHGNSWSSCHSIKNGGCYHGGILNMMNDKTSVVTYTLSEEKYRESLKNGSQFWDIPKVSRSMFFIGEGVLMNTYSYPKGTFKDYDCITELLKNLISSKVEYDNQWECTDLDDEIYINSDDYLGYCDWECSSRYILSYMPYHYNACLKIGEDACPLNNANKIHEDSEGLFEASGDICEACGYRTDDGQWLTNNNGYDYLVCWDCLRNDDDYYYCEGSSRYYNQYHDDSIWIGGSVYNEEWAHNNLDFVECEQCGDLEQSDFAHFAVGLHGSDYAFCGDGCRDRFKEENSDLFEEED